MLAAFAGAVAGDTIKAQEMEFFDGPPISLNSTGLVTFQGGYDPEFKTGLGFTTLSGSLSLIKGAVVVAGLIIS